MDYETYSEKEMLEFSRAMARAWCDKVWKTCLLLSAMETGRIDRNTAIREYGHGEQSLCNLLARFKADRRMMVRTFGRRHCILIDRKK